MAKPKTIPATLVTLPQAWQRGGKHIGTFIIQHQMPHHTMAHHILLLSVLQLFTPT
jgi:hypothetical protein